MSSSDEEDCDNEDSDSSDSGGEYENKKKVRKVQLVDIVDKLIERDKELSKRDLDCRVRKLKMKHNVK
jgi:hypothetical protein